MAGVMGDPIISYSVFYWILAVLMFGAGFLTAWIIAKGLKVSWYVWLLGAIGTFGLIATAQHGVTTFLERAPFAFWPGMLLFGLPSVILIGVAFQLFWRQYRTQESYSTQTKERRHYQQQPGHVTPAKSTQ
jgi:hypothetical protein